MGGVGTPDARDVIVVGGGPAGTAVAIFLRQCGRDVLLLDQACFPRDKVCGEGISPEAWRLLDRLDAKLTVEALRPFRLRGMQLTSPDGTCFEGTYANRFGLSVRRLDFDRALLDVARGFGAEVREASRVIDLVRVGTRTEGVVIDGGRGVETLRARLVIGADGRGSVVARKLGLLQEDRAFRKFAVRGYWEGMEGLDERGEMHVGGGGYCGIAPLSWTRANVTFVLDQAEMAPSGGDLEGFYRSALDRRWPRIAERLSRGVLCGKPRAVGPLALSSRGVSAPGALLVGDAAGFFDPFTGEGVTLALRSAELASAVADRALDSIQEVDLRGYDRARHAATRSKFRFNRWLQVVVGHPALANLMAHRLAHRSRLADQLVGVAGDFVPARTVLGPDFLVRLFLG